jgi:hypothetical protein
MRAAAINHRTGTRPWRFGINQKRVLESLENARRKGSQLGRPNVLAWPDFEERWLKARMRLVDQQIGKRQAARQLKVGAERSNASWRPSLTSSCWRPPPKRW